MEPQNLPVLCLFHEWRRSWTTDLRPGRRICHQTDYFQEEQIIQKGDLLSRGWEICGVSHNSSSVKTAISTRVRIGLLRKCYFEETKKEHGIHVKPARFLKISGQQKYCQLGLKGTGRTWNQRRVAFGPPNAIGKMQAGKSHLQSATFVKKEGWPKCSHKLRGEN